MTATLIGLIPLSGTKVIFDNVLGDKPLPEWMATLPWAQDPQTLLILVACVMISLSLLSLAIATTSRWHATVVSKRIQVIVRQRAFDHAIRLPLHRVQEMKTGGASSILRDDAGAAGDLVFGMFYNPWRAVVQLLGTLAILAYTDWRLLLWSIFIFPVIFITHKTWISRIRPMFADIRATRQYVDGHTTESFGGIRVVRGFSRQRHETARFVRNNHVMARQELTVWWWHRGVEIVWQIVIPVSTAFILIYGGMRIIDPADPFTTGELVMFLAFLMWLLEPLAMLAQSAASLQNGLAALDRVLDILAEPTESQYNEKTLPFDRSQVAGRVTLEHVSYRYPGTMQDALYDITFDVQPGEMVALVGPSGAGKTTLSNLIARFFEPTAGRMLLDGRDVSTIDLESYRGMLGIVEQDVFLFDGTIAQNIAYGKRDATDEQIIHAAKRANAHAFITAFDRGYDTRVGERGVKLSGGQRQRIAIARAILADPTLLILDEATSNLDTESERLIQASLAQLMHQRTSFVIAHRLSTITHADRIVVVENGAITEQGTHDELMARSGRYAEMVAVQTRPVQQPRK